MFLKELFSIMGKRFSSNQECDDLEENSSDATVVHIDSEPAANIPGLTVTIIQRLTLLVYYLLVAL